ncbi:MAG: NAD(P)-dependent oxidoreductase [Candidatus Omnitrophica bacterium]|nr:NAD(P)-dependent oxidoreductase [Candidatus Omnitrophota bacterium]
MHYLVTGGSGFIGSALVRRLVQEGHTVRVFDNLSRGMARRLSGLEGQIEFIQGDVRDADAVDRAVRGTDSVCHLAFINGTEFFYQKPGLVMEVGIKGMFHVMDACHRHGTPELVLASSSEVYQTPPSIPTAEDVPLSVPNPLNPRYSYGSAKIIGELLALHYAAGSLKRVLIFRPHNVYGPDMGWEHVIPQFVVRMKRLCEVTGEKSIRFPIQGTGDETRAFVHIDDFVEGLWRVMQKGEHRNIYHIGTREEVPMRRIASLVGEYFGRKVEVERGVDACWGTPRRCPDITRLEVLGYRPRLTLAEGLPGVARWYDEHSHEAPDHGAVKG